MATNVSERQPAPAPAGQRPKSFLARWWLFLTVVVLAGAGGAAWWLHASQAASKHGAVAEGAGDEGAARSSETVYVETTHPTKGGITRMVTQIGTIHAFEWADLYAKVSGYLDKLHVDYGDRVKKGQVLAEISDPEIVKERDRAREALTEAKAAVKQAEARLETAKADAEAAKAAVEQAAAEIDRQVAMVTFRGKVLARYKNLVAREAESQQLVEEEEHHLESARADERAARAARLTAQAQYSAARSKIAQAEADLAQAKAKVGVDEDVLAKAQVLVDYTKISSPYDGVITRRNFFPGAFIRSAEEGGAVPVLTVARTDKMRVETWVPDRDVPFTKVGNPAEVTVDALGNEVFKGQVSRFSYVEDPRSRTMYTEIDIPNPNERLKEGMFGTAKILNGREEHALTIPASCLVGESHGGKAEVFVVKNGKAAKTQITIGANDGIRVEVLSGLTPNDELITSTSAVSEGMAVRAKPKDVAAR